MYLGEEGTENFTVETILNGKRIQNQLIHDPFISTTIGISRWDRIKSLFSKYLIIKVNVRGTEGAERAIMTLDPSKLHEDSRQILIDRAVRVSNLGPIALDQASTRL